MQVGSWQAASERPGLASWPFEADGHDLRLWRRRSLLPALFVAGVSSGWYVLGQPERVPDRSRPHASPDIGSLRSLQGGDTNGCIHGHSAR